MRFRDFIINLDFLGISIYLFYSLILSIPNNGKIMFDFNSIGEIWLDMIMMLFFIIFTLGVIIIDFRKFLRNEQ